MSYCILVFSDTSGEINISNVSFEHFHKNDNSFMFKKTNRFIYFFVTQYKAQNWSHTRIKIYTFHWI